MKADEILKEWAAFFKERNENYGNAYLRFGEVVSQMFPNGIILKTADDFYFFHIFTINMVKMIRITNAMSKGEHHTDSWKDIAVYAAMYMEKLKETK